jgi:surface antigen
MFSMKKTALLAAISAFALGFSLDTAGAGDGRRHDRAAAHQGAKIRVLHQTSGTRRHNTGPRTKVIRAHHRRQYRRAPRWVPPHRGYRNYRYYRKYRHLDRRRYYRPKHKHWKHRGQGANNELFGTVIGAALGAVIGNSVSKGHGKGAIIVGGAVVGGIIGNQIGRSMDEADHHRTVVVLETSRTGHPVEGTNPDNGTRYTMTPTRTYRNAAGEDCREYTVWGWVDGYEEKLHGTACRSEDGAWRTVT